MYQNIYYERQKNLMHLWDDKNGYQTMPYRKYAYKKDPHGQHLSMNGEKLTRISKWEKDEADDLFESDVPETTRVAPITTVYESTILVILKYPLLALNWLSLSLGVILIQSPTT